MLAIRYELVRGGGGGGGGGGFAISSRVKLAPINQARGNRPRLPHRCLAETAELERVQLAGMEREFVGGNVKCIDGDISSLLGTCGGQRKGQAKDSTASSSGNAFCEERIYISNENSMHQGLYEDPDGVKLPPSLMATSWKRPSEYITGNQVSDYCCNNVYSSITAEH